MSKLLAPKLLATTAIVCGALLPAGCHRGGDADQSPAPQEIGTVPSNPSGPATEAAPDADTVKQIRQAVRDFIKEKMPDGKVEGVWTLLLGGNYAFAAADVASNSTHRSVDVLVRLYTRDNGSEYWRAESSGPYAWLLKANHAPIDEASNADGQ